MLRRLYIAHDDDQAGDGAIATLLERTQEAGIEAIVLSTRRGDFNEALRFQGINALQASIDMQLATPDVIRVMEPVIENVTRYQTPP